MAGEEKFAPISEQFVLETLVREKRRVRKLAIAILLIICLLYFVSFLFFVQYVPIIFLLVVSWFASNRPESIPLYTNCDRLIALERGAYRTDLDRGLFVRLKKHFIVALSDRRILFCSTIHYALNFSLGSASSFLPIIVKTFGYTNAHTLFILLLPYIVGTTMLFTTSTMDRKNRVLVVFGGCFAETIGHLLVVLAPHSMQVNAIGAFLVYSGIYTAVGIIIVWFVHSFSPETRKFAQMPFLLIGQPCGVMLGAIMYPSTDSFLCWCGFTFTCALQVWAMICSIILYKLCKQDNVKRRNELDAKSDPGAMVDTSTDQVY
ncbi:hypothetical protein SCLCIDRAFT_18871 [Scleroderma citrinum Foug A]|uniref:Major facilitator superfamily (MFS) profile domain-containing protein n=1 Tax=Scleroderma citrinum Foug A TaxID=1036808 RepID=A0A0C3AAS8_9AGAM|nr:hypothetical protein SCLCIDRAFT_18871 [Scleroderma citrinum Foug A]